MATTQKAAGAVLSVSLLLLLLTGCAPSGAKLLRDGERLINDGRPADALRKLAAARDLLPDNAQVWNQLGLAHHGAGQVSDAERAYRRALEIDRDLVAARFNLGCLQLEQGSLTEALSELTTYTRLQGHVAEGWLKLAAAQLRSRQFDAAERSFTYALQLKPGQPEALNGLGLIHAQRKRPRDAAKLFNDALARQPDYAPALLNLAVINHQQLGNRPAALEKYQAYAALNPPPPNAAAVAELARSLDAELHPAPKAFTFVTPPAPVTNTAPPAPAPVARLTPSNAAPIVAATPPSRATSQVPRATAPPAPSAPPATSAVTAAPAMKPAAVEVVQLPEEPAIKPARDVAGPSAKRSPSEAKAAPAPLPPTPPPLISEVPAKEERPGFFQRLNPFRSRRARSGESEAPTPLNAGGKPAASAPQEKTAPAPPALPPPAAITKAEPKIVSEPAPAPKPAPKPVRVAVASPTPLPPKVEETPKPAAAPVPTPPPAPSYPRYKYLNPAPPAAGNRRTAELLFDRGTRAQRDGRFNEAITDYQAALRADPAYFEALYNLGLAAYAAGQTGLSLSAYERGLSINPTHLNARYNFALALQKAGYVRDAASELERLLVDHPLETRAHLTLGNLYSQDLSQNARAREHYQKVLQLDPRHPQAGTIRYWLSSNP